MSRSAHVTVEVDLCDFDDDEIIAEAESRMARFGSDGESYRKVFDLAAAIAAGDTDEAMYRLDALVGETSVLRQAIDLGRWKGAK